MLPAHEHCKHTYLPGTTLTLLSGRFRSSSRFSALVISRQGFPGGAFARGCPVVSLPVFAEPGLSRHCIVRVGGLPSFIGRLYAGTDTSRDVFALCGLQVLTGAEQARSKLACANMLATAGDDNAKRYIHTALRHSLLFRVQQS